MYCTSVLAVFTIDQSLLFSLSKIKPSEIFSVYSFRFIFDCVHLLFFCPFYFFPSSGLLARFGSCVTYQINPMIMSRNKVVAAHSASRLVNKRKTAPKTVSSQSKALRKMRMMPMNMNTIKNLTHFGEFSRLNSLSE